MIEEYIFSIHRGCLFSEDSRRRELGRGWVRVHLAAHVYGKTSTGRHAIVIPLAWRITPGTCMRAQANV
jgi:hypothetical protein